MPSTFSRLVPRTLVIVAAVGLVGLLMDVLTFRSMPDLIFLFAYLAVFVVSWLGGLWPGLTVTILVLAVTGSPVESLATLVRTFLFLGGGIGISALTESLHRARRLAEAEAIQRRHEQDRLQRLVATAHEGIWLLGPGGVIEFANRRMAELLGTRPEEMLDQPISTYLHPESATLIEERLRVRQESPFDFRNSRMRRYDGSDLWVNLSFNPSLDADGQLQGGLVMITDATEHRLAVQELRAERDFAAAVMEAAGSPVVVLDRGGRILRANRAFAEVTSQYDDEPSLLWAAAIEPAARERLRSGFFLLISRGGTATFDVPYRTPQGDERLLSWTLSTLLNAAGTVAHIVAVGTDLTARQRQAAELQLAMEAAEAAGRAKDLFLATLSHELRTPLTPALLGVSALLEEDELTGESRSLIEIVQRGIQLEARLIDDLLDLTRIGRGKLRMVRQRLDMHQVIRDSIAACRHEIESGGLRLDVHLDAASMIVAGDAARLQQVAWNLLRNAAKFTPKGGEISVKTRNSPSGKRLILQVSDTGIGIAAESLTRIFGTFEQGETEEHRRPDGLGLGLAISKAFVEAHDGRLTAASEGVGHGATFTLELLTYAGEPRKRDNDGPAIPPVVVASGPLRLLIVEDDLSTQQILRRLLTSRGHRLATASGVGEALEKLRDDGPFDLVISDLGLPDGSGFDLMPKLRSGGIRIGIALSGYGMEEDRRRSREAGFQAHLTKPVDFDRLIATIHELTSSVADPATVVG